MEYQKQVAIKFPEFADYTSKTKSMALFYTNLGLDIVLLKVIAKYK